ncbi:MAG: ABC transporter permease [Phycisphaerales bacterium]|nr:ABC transporter permease [Phycisphaerales bacterium]
MSTLAATTRSPGVPTMLALTRRELVRIVRQPSRLLASVATPLLVWLLLGSGFARSFQSPAEGSLVAGIEYGAYLLPGMATMTVLFSSIFGAMSLIQDRHEGFLQSVLVSPTPRWAIAASKLLGSSLIATAQAVCLLPAAFLLGDGIGAAGAGMAVVALLCTAIGIAGLGLACAWWVDSTQGFHGVMNLVLLPMWLLSGSVFPVAGASGWMKVIMMANPVTWCTAVLHNALGHNAGDPVVAWAVTVGFACLGVVLGWTTLGRGIRRF